MMEVETHPVPGGNGAAAPGEARDGHGRDLVFVGCCHPKAREPGYVGPQLTLERMERVWPKLVGCPLLDNHKKGREPIGRVVDARVDGEHQLWIQGEINESTPEGARVAALIRSGQYAGLSLGMQHWVVSRASGAPPREPGREVEEAGWEDVEDVVWSNVFEISVCPKGKYPNTHLFFTLASEDAGEEGGVGGGEISLSLSATAAKGAAAAPPLPFSTGRITGDSPSRPGRLFSSAFRAPAPREKTASTALNPTGGDGPIANTTATTTSTAPAPATPSPASQQQGNGASLPPTPARPSPVPRYSDGKFAPYRAERTDAGQLQQQQQQQAGGAAAAGDQKAADGGQKSAAAAAAAAGDQKAADGEAAADGTTKLAAINSEIERLRSQLKERDAQTPAMQKKMQEMQQQLAMYSEATKDLLGTNNADGLVKLAQETRANRIKEAHDRAQALLPAIEEWEVDADTPEKRALIRRIGDSVKSFVTASKEVRDDPQRQEDIMGMIDMIDVAGRNAKRQIDNERKGAESVKAELEQYKQQLAAERQQKEATDAKLKDTLRMIDMMHQGGVISGSAAAELGLGSAQQQQQQQQYEQPGRFRSGQLVQSLASASAAAPASTTTTTTTPFSSVLRGGSDAAPASRSAYLQPSMSSVLGEKRTLASASAPSEERNVRPRTSYSGTPMGGAGMLDSRVASLPYVIGGFARSPNGLGIAEAIRGAGGVSPNMMQNVMLVEESEEDQQHQQQRPGPPGGMMQQSGGRGMRLQSGGGMRW